MDIYSKIPQHNIINIIIIIIIIINNNIIILLLITFTKMIPILCSIQLYES